MKAISLDSPKHFRFTNLPDPGKPSDHQVLLRVHRVGICGTDYGGYLGKMPFYSYPRIPGHELGVEVLEVGRLVDNLRVGDRCSVEPYINCQECYSCQRGLTNCCEHHKTLGVMCDGGMTERILLPARKVHPSKSLTYEQLALVETLAIGSHAIDRAKPQEGEHVLIIGAGPIGLSAIEFSKISGAKTIVMDISPDRLQFVREQMKVPSTIQLDPNMPQQALEQLRSMTSERLADVVVDATGSNKSMATALEYCSFGGRLVYVGITQAEIVLPHAPIMHRRELTIMASRNALTRDFSKIIRLIEEGRIDTVPWITHHAPFEAMIDTFPSWLLPESRVIKALISID